MLEGDPPPLPYPQLTRLQLWGGDYEMDDVLVMISKLPQLENLELLGMQEPDELEAVQLSQLPNLRTVNFSFTPLWGPAHSQDPPREPRWVPICECMPKTTIARLTLLQQVAPRINWVLDFTRYCDAQRLDRVSLQ
jgi:hypothetical protein